MELASQFQAIAHPAANANSMRFATWIVVWTSVPSLSAHLEQFVLETDVFPRMHAPATPNALRERFANTAIVLTHVITSSALPTADVLVADASPFQDTVILIANVHRARSVWMANARTSALSSTVLQVTSVGTVSATLQANAHTITSVLQTKNVWTGTVWIGAWMWSARMGLSAKEEAAYQWTPAQQLAASKEVDVRMEFATLFIQPVSRMPTVKIEKPAPKTNVLTGAFSWNVLTGTFASMVNVSHSAAKYFAPLDPIALMVNAWVEALLTADLILIARVMKLVSGDTA